MKCDGCTTNGRGKEKHRFSYNISYFRDAPKSNCIVTTRIPKEWGRYCFHRCLSVHINGWGGTPIRPTEGYPHPADRGVPTTVGQMRLANKGGGGTTIWLMGGRGTPIWPKGGVPPSGWWGYPHWDWMGYKGNWQGWLDKWGAPIWLMGGSTPIWPMGGGRGIPLSDPRGVPPSGWWGYPHWDWMGYKGGWQGWLTSEVPPSGWWGGSTPIWLMRSYPHWDWTRYPPLRLNGGTPHPSGLDAGNPPPHQETDQQSEHLLCSGRYASCVHAGGLSCLWYRQKSIVAHNWIVYLHLFVAVFFQLDSCKDFNERRKIRAAIRELGSKPPDGKPKEQRIGRVSLTDDYVSAKDRRNRFSGKFQTCTESGLQRVKDAKGHWLWANNCC